MYNYNFEDIFAGIGIAFGAMGFFFSIFAVIGIVLFVLKGFGLYRMAKTIGLSNPWLSFIPFADVYALGRIAEKYIKRDGKKSAKFSIILPILYVAEFIIAIALVIFAFIMIFSLIVMAEDAALNDNPLRLEIMTFIPTIISYFLLFAVAVSYQVLFFVALWRIYSIFDNSNATLYTVLSVLFSILAPIFIFIISKNTPAFDYKARMGYFDLEQQ